MFRIIRLAIVLFAGFGLVGLFILALPTSAARKASQGADIGVDTPDDEISGEILQTRRVLTGALNVDYIGHTGGGIFAVTVVGDYAYIGEGYSLTILDISEPGMPEVVGRSGLLPGRVQGVAVLGGYAYVASVDVLDTYYSSLRVIDISDPTDPDEVAYVNTPGTAEDVAVSGNYAYVADGGSGLRVIDISDPNVPSEVGFHDTTDWTVGIAIKGNYAYVADGWTGLRVIDVSDPTNPIEVAFTGPAAYDVVVVGDYAYIASGTWGLTIIDVSDPTNPLSVGSFDTPGYTNGVAVQGSYAYIADIGNLRVIDVSDPTNPIEVAFTGPAAYDVVVVGDYAYIVSATFFLTIIDVSDPANPFETSYCNTPYYPHGIALDGNYSYLADRDRGLRVIDMSDPVTPGEVGFYDTPGDSWGVAVEESYAYVADGSAGGLRVIDISDPSNPSEVGYFDTPGYAKSVDVEGDYAYLAESGVGIYLRVIDISDPTNPSEVGDLPGGGSNGVDVVGDYAYVSYGGLRVIDVSDPSSPIEVGIWYGPGEALAVQGNYTYIAGGDYGLRVIDVTDPADPKEVGFSDTPGYAVGVAVQGDFAYVADGSSGLRVIDVTNPTNPNEVGYYVTLGWVWDVAVAGSFANLAVEQYGLHVLNYTGVKDDTTVNITNDSPDPSSEGEPFSVTFLVSADFGIPSGVVTVTVEGESPSCIGELVGGEGGCEISLNNLGIYTLTADYSGDDYFLPSSDDEQHTVKVGTMTEIITDEPDPSFSGEPFLVTYAVNANFGIPSGVVTVTVEGESSSCNGVLVGGMGGCEISLNNPGFYTLNATYSGDDTYLSSSDDESHIVRTETKTMITSDEPEPSQFGEPFMVSFEVSADYGIPNGTVIVNVEGEAASCNGVLVGGMGGCEITLNALGSYTLTANYNGNAYFLPSSDSEMHTVIQAETMTEITADEPDPSLVGEPFTVTYSVSADYGIPSGAVTVNVAGDTVICTGTLFAGIGDCEITLNTPGTYTLTATYSGDDFFLPSSAEGVHVVEEDMAMKEVFLPLVQR